MTALFDFDRLDSFAMGDRALERELCGMFLATASSYLDELQRSVACVDSWSAVAHSLKGAAGNIGATAVSELALVAERAAPDAAHLAQLQTTFASTRLLLESHLARP